jgi:hypothetical protein
VTSVSRFLRAPARRRFLATAAGAALLAAAAPGFAAGVLSVDVLNGYNLVVDSNVTAPSTYAPRAAYIGARVCNTGDAALTGVIAHVGDYRAGVGDTPGVFPVTSFPPNDAARPHLADTGSYSLTLESGATGAADGTRYVGTLAPGDCRLEYWLISYPQCVNVGGQPQLPPCDVSITGGAGPEDDLGLDYDIWVTSAAGAPLALSRTLTMRNEISAAANKIWPNTTAKVPDAYLAAIQSVVGWGTLGPDGQPLTVGDPVFPGQRVITTQGIWYDLGNVGHGFDNNGDLVPDQNAWVQPVGDPASFDAACFRLVNVYGILVVKLKTGGDQLIPFANQLYFQGIPDNTGVVGLVYYQYVATGTGCSGNLTPYQESASGFDNEKFSADYGLSLGLASGSYEGRLTFTKTDNDTLIAANDVQTYVVTADNVGTGANLGAPDLGVPLVVRERIPPGMVFVAGSADDAPATNLTEPSGSGTYQQVFTDVDGNVDPACTIAYTVTGSTFALLYSVDGGATWTTTEPAAASVTDIQWELRTTLALDGYHDGRDCVAADGTPDGTLETSLPVGKAATVRFQARVGANPEPVVCNTAVLQYGTAASGVTAKDCDLVSGNNTLSGSVFQDNGAGGGIFGNGVKDGTEAGIGAGVVVELFYDANGDGTYGGEDLLYASTATAAGGGYSFANIPDGPFLVVVRKYGLAGAGNDVDDFVPGWGDTTYDPNLPLTTNQGPVKLGEDLNVVTLAVNVDRGGTTGTGQSVANVSFGFAPPLKLAKVVQNNPDANADGRADATLDEGDALTYVIALENRLPSVGRQGPSGCEYTVWAGAGATGNSPKNFTNPGAAWDAPSPNGAVASALVDGGGLRWLYGRSYALAPQLGTITKVEALYFGYFSKPLSDDFLTLEASFGADANGLTTPLKTGTLSTAMIDSYVGPRPDYDPNSAIAWDITAARPGCTTCGAANWGWADFPLLYLLVKADKASAADAKYFYLDAVGVRVTADKDCEAGASTTLSPVPLRDSYDPGSFAFVSADPAPSSVNTATGVIQWDDVGPILPGTTRNVKVTLRALDVTGLRTGTCGASAPPAANSACNWAETAYDGRHVAYADGRPANDDSGKIAVAIQGKAELRGTVWNDANNSGWNVGAGEAGMPGVVVTLYACTQSDGVTLETGTPNTSCANTKNGGKNDLWVKLATAVTDAGGAYEFIGLDTGYYVVEVGDTDGQPAVGTGGNAAPFGKTQTAEPNDNQSVTAGSANAPPVAQVRNNTWGDVGFNLSALNILSQAAEETIDGVNFGYYSAAAVIHGTVWHDVDGDAAADGGDTGLAGFTVKLSTDPNGDGNPADGALVATTVSGAAGDYAFSGLAAGSYVVIVVPPTLRSTAWVETVETTGAAASLNNQIPVTVAAGAFSGPHSFGYTQHSVSAVGDTLYFDFDADGHQGATEAGIPDVTVWLYSDTDRDGTVDAGVDTLLDSVVTDASGKYRFENLAAGSYVVRVDTADPDFPSDVTPTGDPDTDAASIGELVWYDLNGDGSRQAGEDGIAGVVVNLYEDADGSGTLGAADRLVSSTVTNAGGAYLFTGLNAGAYFVDVDETSLPGAGLALTTPDPAGTLVTLAGRTAATQVLTANAGYSPAANFAIGNRVWSDADGDNVQDAGEVGIPGVRVVVTNGTGTGCAAPCTATTDAGGFWIVTGLTGGTFTVDVTNADLPRDFTLTGGTDPRTVTVAGADLANVDFGFRYNTDANPLTKDAGDPTGSITGRVFNDADGDAVYDAGEALGGTTVNLLDDGGAIIGTTSTAADGTYAFVGVFIGNYAVQVVDRLGTRYSVVFLSAGEAFPNLNVAYSATVETTADAQSAVSVDGVHADLNQDFGFQRFQGSIGDTVYQDVNENATQDPGEPGIAGVTVGLSLWKDAVADGGNGDGVVDAAELTALATAATTADDPLTAADEGGKYLFSNLEQPPAGQYFVVRVDTATLPGTAPTLIGDPDMDGDVCPVVAPLNPLCDDQQAVLGFSSGINYLGADFGYRVSGPGYGTVGDHLWVDTDGDGAVGSGELGVSFVTVWFDTDDDGTLDWSDANGNLAWDAGEGERWVETDSDGYYAFTGVADGTYNLRVLATDAQWPAGLPTTPVYEARAGNTGSRNNLVQVVVAGGAVTSIVDGDPGTTDTCTDCNLAADFGYRYAGANSLRGTVCAQNGALDGYCGATATTVSGVGAGESPLSGVQVTLYRWDDADADGTAWSGATLDAGDTFTLLGSAATDVSGDYVFPNVPDNVVVVLSVSETQRLRLATTNTNTSVEDANVVSRQLYEGTATYGGLTVSVLARQALNLGPDADDAIVDLDFAFDTSLGGAITYDFGDLPESAPNNYDATLLASDGARHEVSGIRLGALVAGDVDGNPSALADHDTDDDGVVLLSTNWVPGAGGAGVEVTSSAAGWLAAWVDFNNDGDFADTGELVVDQAVATGAQVIAFDVPDTLGGSGLIFFARFRVYPVRPMFVSSSGPALDALFRPAGGEVEDYRWNVNVTPAIVTSFTARDAGGAVALEWRTSSAVGTVGFFLRRRDGADAPFTDVNERLLPALIGTPQGGTYRYLDRGANAGGALEYQLVEIESSGRRTVHGPYRVDPRAAAAAGQEIADAAAAYSRTPSPAWASPDAVPAVDAGGAGAADAAALDAAPLDAGATAGPLIRRRRAKILTAAGGLHYLRIEDLARELGVTAARARTLLGEGRFRMRNRDGSVAFLPAAGRDGVFFFAEPQESTFTRDNVYWMRPVAAAGRSMRRRNEDAAGRATGAETFARTERFEQDVFPAHALASDARQDHWAWEYFVAGEPAKSFALRADGIAPGAPAAELSLLLLGATDTPADPDHHVEVRLNGVVVGDLRWNGLASLQATLAVDPALLADGENTLEIAGLADTAAPYSVFYLDSFALRYESRYRAVADRLTCDTAANAVVRLGGFSTPNILVFDVTAPRHPVLVRAQPFATAPGEYGVDVAPAAPGRVYHAATLESVTAADRVRGDAPSTLRSPENRGAYLVVTTAGLKAEARRLAAYRRGRVIDLEDVYDEFNGGVASPYALRSFLRYAWRNWRVRPRYVVLAGDGSYDYRDNLGLGGNLVPPMLIPTDHGLFASDTWFADVAGGPAPEIAIGRLPAANAEELGRLVDKILLREGAAGQDWTGRLVALADDGDDAGDFAADSDRISDLAPADVAVDRIHLGPLSIGGARAALFSALADGAGLVSYFGHAGYDTLADEGLLTTADVASLGNAAGPTVLTAMTCLAGDFSLPGYPGIGEVLVRSASGGAAAVWAPTGLSVDSLAGVLAEGFYRSVFADRKARVGDAVLAAMRAYEKTRNPPFMLGIYVLLGDPAMRLR